MGSEVNFNFSLPTASPLNSETNWGDFQLWHGGTGGICPAWLKRVDPTDRKTRPQSHWEDSDDPRIAKLSQSAVLKLLGALLDDRARAGHFSEDRASCSCRKRRFGFDAKDAIWRFNSSKRLRGWHDQVFFEWWPVVTLGAPSDGTPPVFVRNQGVCFAERIWKVCRISPKVRQKGNIEFLGVQDYQKALTIRMYTIHI